MFDKTDSKPSRQTIELAPIQLDLAMDIDARNSQVLRSDDGHLPPCKPSAITIETQGGSSLRDIMAARLGGSAAISAAEMEVLQQ